MKIFHIHLADHFDFTLFLQKDDAISPVEKPSCGRSRLFSVYFLILRDNTWSCLLFMRKYNRRLDYFSGNRISFVDIGL